MEELHEVQRGEDSECWTSPLKRSGDGRGNTHWSQRQAIMRGSFWRFIFIHGKTNPINNKGGELPIFKGMQEKAGAWENWAGCSLVPNPALGVRSPLLLPRILHALLWPLVCTEQKPKSPQRQMDVSAQPAPVVSHSSPSLSTPALLASGLLPEPQTHTHPSASALADRFPGIPSQTFPQPALIRLPYVTPIPTLPSPPSYVTVPLRTYPYWIHL